MEKERKKIKLYGIGVGPGDPELLTLKAVRLMGEADVIAVPTKEIEESIAWKIAVQACPVLREKECIGIPMPMTKDEKVLEQAQEEGANRICAYLKEGRSVAVLTIGDPTVYSTYMYLQKKVVAKGYEAEIVNGIPSFCAAAGRLGIALGSQEEEIHVIPASYDVKEALKLSGTKVLMKAGKKLAEVTCEIKRNGQQGYGVTNASMEDERVYQSLEELPEQAGYLTLLIVKEGEKE